MSTQTSDNNKRIAKNTLLLYFRMLFMMVVSLYTSRVILNTLGVEDYGINNVVGGVVTMLAFINNAMSSATQRYITFELGKHNRVRLNHIFSTALQIHGLISLLIFILGETIGLWFFYEKLVIPIDRMNAAMWVYQCSIVSAVVGIMSVPYNADIVAHEKMSAFVITAKPKAHAFKNEMCFPLTKTKCELKKHPNSKFECFFNDFNRTRTSLFLPFPSKLIQDNLVCVLELQE